jgi:tetratricopeptide (TPR) repeat protein
VQARLGRPELAAEYHRKALALFTTIGEQDGQAWALNGLGEADHLAGDPARALDHHRDALSTATAAGATDQQARAHAGLGNALRTLGNHTEARTHYERALVLYGDAPQAGPVRAVLAEL